MKNKIYIISFIFGFIAVSLVLFFIWPLLAEIKNNSKNLLSIKNDTYTLEMQNSEIEIFKKVYKDYRPNLEKINQLFINPQNPVDFIKFLENASDSSGIASKISLLPNSQQEKQDAVIFQLFVNGDFLKILHFLEKIENGPYLIEIQNASIRKTENEKKSKNDTPGIVDASFKINAFSKKQ